MGSTLPSEEELGRAKRYLIGTHSLRYQTQGAVLADLAVNWLRGLPPEALADFIEAVKAVTAEKVREVGRRYFASRLQTAVIGGDASAIADEIEHLGVFQILR